MSARVAIERVLDAIEVMADRIEQVVAVGRERDATGTAIEQRAIEPLFEVADLVAERTHREVELLRGKRQLARAGDQNEPL